MATYVKYNQFTEDLAKKVHNLSADSLKVALTNAAPNVATHVVLGDITDLSTANGYTAGGTAPSITSCVQTSGVLKLILGDVVFTASGGTIGPFRYAVLYNSTPSSPLKPLIAYHDYGSSISVLNGETFTWDADASTGVLTIT